MKPRFEFVVVFTWKEPTPSDKLRPIKVAEPPAGGAGRRAGSGAAGGPAVGRPAGQGRRLGGRNEHPEPEDRRVTRPRSPAPDPRSA